MRRFLAALAVLSMKAGAVSAVGTEDDAPPPPSETTTVCEEGQVWDAEAQLCVPLSDVSDDNAALEPIIRELAYAERFADAAYLLDLLPVDDGFALTYRGYLARKTGDLQAAKGFYLRAISSDPGNILARAYYGMGLVDAGDRAEAELQLAAIIAEAGEQAWPARALQNALKGVSGLSY